MKWLSIILIFLCLITPCGHCVYADVNTINIYQIYDENGVELTQRENVVIGDKFIDKNFNEFEVYLIDESNLLAKARYTKTYKRPNIVKKGEFESISSKPKKIALYMTHNDESYLIGDGVDSVYGAGGIHDVAKELKKGLEEYGINVSLDETLHIPHNSSAYSRSNVTAVRLLQDKPDAIFDIHRDGASRKYYVANVDGKERSKIRIVLGQSNVNSSENLEFALYLLSVAEIECPWLFHDIYWGKGHYNQALSNKALLFEMGAYTIEKDLVLDSSKELAKVLNTALYKTTIDDDNLTIGDEYSSEKPTINEKFNSENQNKFNWLIVILPSIVGLAAIIIAVAFGQKKK